jgi:uncharacterized repeat protein (TIGR01451 family)
MISKFTIMRKILPLLFFVAFAGVSHAQLVSFSVTTPACNHNGVLAISFTGITPPSTVSYVTSGTSGATIIHTGVTGLFDVFTSYSGGPVTVTVTDDFGHTATGSYIGSSPFTYTLIPRHAVCPTLGNDTVSVTGGTAPYTYQWYNKATLGNVGTGNPIYLPVGDYGVEITDASGCVFGSMDKFDFGSFLYWLSAYTDTITTTNANCTNGTAVAGTPSAGAVPPYTYLWSNGATTPSIIGLSAGNYSYTITDALGCAASVAGTVIQGITITAPTTSTAATCIASNGSVTATGAGGTAPYSYVWSNGATTASQKGLTAGGYGVVVTDANGCTGNGTAVVGAITPIAVTYSATPTLCTSATGTATLSIAGGTGPYSIVWFTTPGQTAVTATNLEKGNYGYHVTDAMGCAQDGTAFVAPLDIISGTFSSVPAVCTLSNGSMKVIAMGGAAPYHYLWSNGATTSGITAAPSALYHVTITDNLGCSAMLSEMLPVSSSLSIGVSSTDASCALVNDGVAFATGLFGNPPYSYSWTGGGSTPIITSLASGPYWVTVTDALGCKASDYTFVSYDTTGSCYCIVTGVVYYDANGNCTQDPGEYGIPNVQISIGGVGYAYTNDTGFYSYKAPAGTYAISETLPANYPLAACQLNNIPVTVAGGIGCVNTVNFANSIDTAHDIQVNTWDYVQPVPGHTYTQITIITNNGTVQEPAVLASHTPDGKLFWPSFVPGGIFSGMNYWYNTSGAPDAFNPGTSQAFLTNYHTPTNITAGTVADFKDTVAYVAPVANWALDFTPGNNISDFTTTVAASSAPNFKEVYPKGTGPAGIIAYTDTVLQYMVHFQNTGSTTAENVVVKDTLDNNLDWTTLKPVFMTNNAQVTVGQVGARKVATFTFSNINLPNAATEPVSSNGMLQYSIHIKSGLPSGTQFRNQASIYFDYNAPMQTNQTLNTLGAVTKVNNTSLPNSGSFTIYPNPANAAFNAIINCDQAGPAIMAISDISGKTLVSKTIQVVQGAQTVQVDISQLTSGIYLVNLNQGGRSQTQKLVVIKP